MALLYFPPFPYFPYWPYFAYFSCFPFILISAFFPFIFSRFPIFPKCKILFPPIFLKLCPYPFWIFLLSVHTLYYLLPSSALSQAPAWLCSIIISCKPAGQPSIWKSIISKQIPGWTVAWQFNSYLGLVKRGIQPQLV